MFVTRKSDHIVIKKIATGFLKLRKRRGLTQEAVRYDTGISIARIEAGNVNLAIDTIARLCDYFEISLGDFFNSLDL